MQRYVCELFEDDAGKYAEMEPHPCGAYVLYSDAIAAQAADKERIKKLEEALSGFVEWDTKHPKGIERSYGIAAQIERELDSLCNLARSALGSGGDEKTATKGEVR